MYSRRFILVGVCIIFVLIGVSLLVFFLNKKGSCHSSTFTCSSGDTCVPQKNVCNGIPDCPHDDDEDEDFCADLYGSVKMIETNWNISKERKDYINSIFDKCELKMYPDYCVCKYQTILYCKDVGLQKIPQNISKEVTRLILANNSIHNLKVDSFKNYRLDMM
ncbi:unnamed protein product [Brassicogethes aeneus]|uniref:Uncharacterized protein n=1 Tax=Brassicogethes aeneus TaxID=1431903 RepID=A0A9P0BGU4_BRAAE|nr:unnamed protein product [Brassicogethes aeneus]